MLFSPELLGAFCIYKSIVKTKQYFISNFIVDS